MMTVEEWIETHDKERELAERVAKVIGKDIVKVILTPHEKLIEELLEVIEDGRTN